MTGITGFDRATEQKFCTAFAKLKANPWKRRTLRQAFRRLAARPLKRQHKPDSSRKNVAPKSGSRPTQAQLPRQPRQRRASGSRDDGSGDGGDPPQQLKLRAGGWI